MRGSQPDVVVFDLGGVFLDWDPRHLFRKLILEEEELELFLLHICSPEWHLQQDLGKEIRAACDELALLHPEHGDLIDAWAVRNDEMIAGLIEGSAEVLRELRSRHIPCYVLSNMERETFVKRRDTYPFLQDFDGYVVSGQEGVAKPDAEIFRRLIERFDLLPERTLFIDDRTVNLEAAAELGFQVLAFTSAIALRSELVDLGLLDEQDDIVS